MRRRRSLDELLPLTLFSSLGTNGLNSSAQMGRGEKGGEARHPSAPRDEHCRGKLTCKHRRARTCTFSLPMLRVALVLLAVHCQGSSEGHAQSAGVNPPCVTQKALALLPGHMFGNTNG